MKWVLWRWQYFPHCPTSGRVWWGWWACTPRRGCLSAGCAGSPGHVGSVMIMHASLFQGSKTSCESAPEGLPTGPADSLSHFRTDSGWTSWPGIPSPGAGWPVCCYTGRARSGGSAPSGWPAARKCWTCWGPASPVPPPCMSGTLCTTKINHEIVKRWIVEEQEK